MQAPVYERLYRMLPGSPYVSHSPEWAIEEAKSVIVGAWSGHEQVVVSIAPEPSRVPAAEMEGGLA